MFWITYILFSIAGGVAAAWGSRTARKSGQAPRQRPLVHGILGLGLIACGVHNALDLVDIAQELNTLGRVLFPLILVAQLGLGGLLAFAALGDRVPGDADARARLRAKLLPMQARLGLLAIATGVAMMLVRGRILNLF